MPDPRAHHVLASMSRVAVLEILRQAGRALGVQELADRMGLHPNTIRAHLELLVEYGHVIEVPDEERRPGRPRRLYLAAPTPESPAAAESPQRNFRLLADILARYLQAADDPRGAAIEAGRLFGAQLVEPGPPDDSEDSENGRERPTVERVLELLDDIGFQPELADNGSAILLRNCPFHEMARDQPDIVCNIHLGLLRGALEQLGAPAAATRLVPFVTPALCVIELGPPLRPERPSP